MRSGGDGRGHAQGCRSQGPQTLAWPERLPLSSRGWLGQEVSLRGGGAFPLFPP